MRKAGTSILAVKENPEYVHFLEKFPFELRNRVYEVLLCRGKVSVKPTGFCDGEPENQLPGRGVAPHNYDLRGRRNV